MAPTTTPPTFPLFPYLPKELRLKIWEFSLLPRVIPVHRSNDRLSLYNHSIAFMTLTTVHQCITSIPNACAESLSVFKKTHIDWKIWDFRKHAYSTAFDPRNDVIFFSHHINHWFLIDFARQYPRETRLMRVLALPRSITKGRGSSATAILEAVHAFEGLRELLIVATEKKKNAVLNLNDGWESLGTADSVKNILLKLKAERWRDWRIPVVRAVESHDDILGRRLASGVGVSTEVSKSSVKLPLFDDSKSESRG